MIRRDLNNYITLGQGSYGTIIYDTNKPADVIKVHPLSSDEIDNANYMYEQQNKSNIKNIQNKIKFCGRLFQGEFKTHLKLFKHKSKVGLIIPRPIEYNYITRNTAKYILSDYACTYKMQKLEYPTKLNSIIKTERLNDFKKTNYEVHSPPYLFFSGLSPEYQNGTVQLSDMKGVEPINAGLYYVINNPAVEKLANSMMDCFFQLTYLCEFILQDVEFLLTQKKNKEPIAGIIDFNQVVRFDNRLAAVKGRAGTDYSLEFDIANTYLFLSGIDTGFFMTDRNTNWKFLPTPNILPGTFFESVCKIIPKIPPKHKTSYLQVISHICQNIYDMEYKLYNERPIKKREIFDSICNKLTVWHELLIYGMLSEDKETPIEIINKMSNAQTLSFRPATKQENNTLMKIYTHWSPVTTNPGGMFDSEYNYFMLKTNTTRQQNNSYVDRFQKSIKTGEITQNFVAENYPHVWFDIMFQRLFIIKYLAYKLDKMTETQINTMIILIEQDAPYSVIIEQTQTHSMHKKSKTIRSYTKKSRISRRQTKTV